MDILTLNKETFDSFLFKSHKIFKEDIQKALERYDKDIYCSLDHKRFVLIHLSERIILSWHLLMSSETHYHIIPK